MIDYFLQGITGNRTNQILEKGLDVAVLRNSVISQNIANVNTPGYKIKKVSFEDCLQRSMKEYGVSGEMTDDRHIPLGRLDISRISPSVRAETQTFYRNDKNNVDIDAEMAKLTKNGLIYQTVLESLNREMGKTSLVISRAGRV